MLIPTPQSINMYSCSHCSKAFANSSNRSRHERLFHRQMESPENDQQEDMQEDQSPEEVPPSDNESDEGALSDDDQDDEGKTNEQWRRILKMAKERLPAEVGADALKMPYLSELVDNVKDIVEDLVQFAQTMQDDEETYGKISARIEEYEEKDYERDEAVDQAWLNSTFLIKRIAQKNADIFNDDERMQSDDSENDEDSD